MYNATTARHLWNSKKSQSTSKHFGSQSGSKGQGKVEGPKAKEGEVQGPWPNLQCCVVMVIIFHNIVIRASEINKGVGLRGPPNKLLGKCQTERWQLYKQKADGFHEVSAVGSLIFGSWRCETVCNREICRSTHSEVANPMGQKSYTFWRAEQGYESYELLGMCKV